MSEPDDLFTLRNHYWLGSYQLAIAEGSGLGRLPEALRVERDEFIYRAYLALGQYSIVLGEVGLCVKMLVTCVVCFGCCCFVVGGVFVFARSSVERLFHLRWCLPAHAPLVLPTWGCSTIDPSPLIGASVLCLQSERVETSRRLTSYFLENDTSREMRRVHKSCANYILVSYSVYVVYSIVDYETCRWQLGGLKSTTAVASNMYFPGCRKNRLSTHTVVAITFTCHILSRVTDGAVQQSTFGYLSVCTQG